MHELYELKEKLMRELEDFGKKDINGSSLQMIDTLAHATKNLCKIIESAEEYSEEGGSSYSRMGGSSRRGGSSYYRAGGSSYRRDSRGRYASNNYYNANDEMIDKLDELMETAPEEMKSDIQRLKSKVESMR